MSNSSISLESHVPYYLNGDYFGKHLALEITIGSRRSVQNGALAYRDYLGSLAKQTSRDSMAARDGSPS